MIRGMSMPYVYYLIQTKKQIMHSLSPQQILMKNTYIQLQKQIISKTYNMDGIIH